MGRRKKCSIALKKGAWTEEEDTLLKRCIEKHGEGNWHKVPLRAGLKRCRKSCRLRWFNYLHPSIKREEFSWDEIDLIIKMHKLLGNRWSLIAARLPGRTANDVKNRWNTYIYKSLQKKQQQTEETTATSKIRPIKPQPWNFSRIKTSNNSIENAKQCSEKFRIEFEKEHSMKWWENLLLDEEADGKAGNNNSSSSGSKDELSFDSFPFDDIIVPNISDMSMCLDLNLWES